MILKCKRILRNRRKTTDTETHVQPSSAPETCRYVAAGNVGKVRQLFEQRRKLTAAATSSRGDYSHRHPAIGRDRSYPLRSLRLDEKRSTDSRAIWTGRTVRNLHFDEIADKRENCREENDLMKAPSWPTLDTCIFGRLPNLGGELLSQRNRKEDKKQPISFSRPIVATTNGGLDAAKPVKVKVGIANGVARMKLDEKPSPKALLPRRSSVKVTDELNLKILRKPSSITRPSEIACEAAVVEAAAPSKETIPRLTTEPVARQPRTPPENMANCDICGRHFTEDRLATHRKVCEKTSKRKRKVFDTMKQRIAGTEAMASIDKIKAYVNQKEPIKSNSWRQSHTEIRSRVKARKELNDEARTKEDAYVSSSVLLSRIDYVQCPHCERRFNERAAERHIPLCLDRHKRMDNRKPKNTNVLKKITQISAKIVGMESQP